MVGLVAVVATALVVSVLSVVAVTQDDRDPLAPLVATDERVVTELDPPDPMKPPAGVKGVDLPAPEQPVDAAAAEIPDTSAKVCDDPGEPPRLPAGGVSALSGLGEVKEACWFEESGQSPDAVDAPGFVGADGFSPAPAPSGGALPGSPPSTDAETSDGPTGDDAGPAGDGPTDAPSDQPSDQSSQGPEPESSDGSPEDPSDGTESPGSPSSGGSAAAQRDRGGWGGMGGGGAVPAAARRDAASAGAPVAASAAAPAGEYRGPNWVKATPVSKPSARYSSSMAYDAQRDQMVLFGGSIVDGFYSNQTWTWDGSNWTLRSPATVPNSRMQATMAWDPVAKRVVMYGGFRGGAGQSLTAEVWAWDGVNWTEITPTGTAPPGRLAPTMAFDPVRGGMVMFGGFSTGGLMNDTWLLKDGAWTLVQANGVSGAPPARAEAQLAYSVSTSQLVLFGGFDGRQCPNCTVFGDTWTLGGASSSWSEESPDHVPPARSGHAMTYDPTLGATQTPGAVVMFGGVDYPSGRATLRNDTWAWTGDDWSKATQMASPPSRSALSMAATDDGQVVMFGGYRGSYLDETWTYDTTVPVLGIEVERASADATGDGTYWAGDTVRVKVSAANAGGVPITTADGVSIVSALQDTLLAAGTQVLWGGDEVDACSGGGSLCGGVADLAATISNISIPVGGTTVGEFLATVAGSQKGCELIDVPAVASALSGGLSGRSVEVSTQITVCGGGLGLEDWWTYDTTDLGGGGTASVNAANGNLVVKQYDTDPVQMPGRLALGLGRVYNSQDLMSGGGPIGAGWQFDVGETGLSAGGFGIGGLKLPNVQSVLQPLSMPYVDRDGTRHVFKLRSITATAGGLSLPIDLTGQQGVADSVLGLLNPATLPFAFAREDGDSPYTRLCIDQAYTGPPGSDMYLFRYIGVGLSSCASGPPGVGALTLGWSLVRPDRVRYDFNALGDLIRVTDPAGQQLVYTPGVTYGPTRIRSGSCLNGPACPEVQINYNAGGAGADRRVEVTDTADRVTSYVVGGSALLPLLKEVWEPGNPYTAPQPGDPDRTDGPQPSASYTYASGDAGCRDSTGDAANAGTSGQLCAVTDALGQTTTFGYEKAPVGPDRVVLVRDRRANVNARSGDGETEGLATKYTWGDVETAEGEQTGEVFVMTADMAGPAAVGSCGSSCHRIRYSGIDAWGRVGQIAEGTGGGADGAGVFYSQAGYFWDGLGESGGIASCAQPTLEMNHNLCQVIRRAAPSAEPILPGQARTSVVAGVTVHDTAVDYLYGDVGQRLRQRVLLDAAEPWTDANSAITTWGSHEQYFDASGNQRFFNTHVRGSGIVKSTAAGGTYKQAVMRDNPVAYWRMDDTAGPTMTSATGTNNGAYGAGARLGADGVVHGNAALGESTTGWGGVVQPLNGFASGATAGSSDFTIETWMRTASTGLEYAFQWGSTSAYATVGRLNGGRPFVTLVSDAAANKKATVYAQAPVADNEWHHVTFRYDGSGNANGIQIWVDGQQSATTVLDNTLDGAFASPNTLSLMGLSVGDSTLDEVALYGTALPEERITAHYAAARGAVRVKPDTLYTVADEVQELSPRGNAAGNADRWGEYLTTTRRDIPADGVLASTNKTAGDKVCGPGARGNTGLVCEVDTPAAAGVARGVCARATSNLPAGSPSAPTPSASYASTCTTYEYNDRGQRSLMRSPKANAAADPSATEYRYYPIVTTCTGEDRTACDLSGTVSAGGWLKAVVDPAGEKLVYAYDAAGNTARTWDRNASRGVELSAGWADPNAPPSTDKKHPFTDTVAGNPITSDGLSVSNTALIAVAADGTVIGAGSNSSGELGNGTTGSSPTEVRAEALTNVVQVAQSATGSYSGCAFTVSLTGEGQVWSTGGGQSVPERVDGLPENIISVSSGGCHAFALDAEGGLWGWGTNSLGQVGNGTTSAVTTPVKVLDKVSAVGAGYVHSLAVTTDGKVWSWGLNSSGQLGLGNLTNRSTPTEVTALASAGIRQLSGGFAASYAVGRDGRVWSFGYNQQSDLGDGTTTNRTSPVQITALGPGTPAGPVRQVVGAAYGAAALMADGTVSVWGVNNAGQSGGGSTDARLANPVQVPGLGGQVALAGGWATWAAADQAGRINVWGATGNHQRADGTNPATTTAPAVAGIDISPYRTPMWAGQGTTDATGNLTTVSRDRLGQPRRTRSPRGHDINTTAYDRMIGYDAAGRPIWSTSAQHRSSATTARTTYDPFGNPVKTIDARGVAARASFDPLNRQRTASVTRGPAGQAPTSCASSATSADWTPAQAGHRICITISTYDGVGRQVATIDANSQVSRAWQDAAGRQVRLDVPRNHGAYTGTNAWLSTRWVYDRDGNVTDVCPPRQFDSARETNTATPNSAAGCTSTGLHSVHAAYDAVGHVTTQTRYRAPASGSGAPEALVTGYSYDADGNTTSLTDPAGHTTTATFDLQGRRLTQTVPRSASKSYTTRWVYDPSGNVTALRAPGSINTGSGADGHLVVDGTNAANSTDGIAHGPANPFQVPDGAQYRNVTLQNGAYLSSSGTDPADAGAHGLMFHATGTVTVCDSCVITMTGKGGNGGAAGSGANGDGAHATNPNPGNGGNGGSGGLLGLDPAGGGGGGHKGDGGTPGPTGTTPGLPGKASGTPDFAMVGTDYLRGSGGGGGGGGKNLLGAGGQGGDGGGFVRITANKIVIDGTIDASGADGSAGINNSGGGGGGAGGGIWLAAPTIDLTAPTTTNQVLDVTGGQGGDGQNNRQGGNGATGRIRLDADAVTNEPAAADRTRAAMITAISYDSANRPIDVIEGAQTTQANPHLDAGEFALPDPHGLANTRTRSIYDADGRVVAVLPPQAFANAASLTAPNTDTARRVDYDLDGLPVASYTPRYDNATDSPTTSVGAGNDGGAGTNQQTTQCPTSQAAPAKARVVDQAAGPSNTTAATAAGLTPAVLPRAYSSQVGVCAVRSSYDPVGNVKRAWLPTSSGGATAGDNGYLDYTYTGDGLAATITGPNPSSTGRVTTATMTYDGVGRPTSTTDANTNTTTTDYTADGLVAQTTPQAYDPDGAGPLTQVVETTKVTYDAAGNQVSMTSPKGEITTQTWTTDGLLATIVAPGPTAAQAATTRYDYDKVGNPTTVWQPNTAAGWAPVRNEFTHDNLIAATHTPITSSSEPDDGRGRYRIVDYAYSPAGLKTATETARCDSTSLANCVPNNPAFKSAGVVKLTYGANGRPASQVGRDRDPTEGPTTSITTTYAPHGGPARVIDPTSGITVQVGYYLDGTTRRVTENTGSSGNPANTNTYAYNAAGSPTVRTDDTGPGGFTRDITGNQATTTSHAYNHAGLPSATRSDVLDATTAYTWDPGGRPLIASTGTHRNEWSWHRNDALETARTSNDSTTLARYLYRYDANRNIIRQEATGATGTYTNDYTYAPGQQLTAWTHQPGTDPTRTTTYTWDRNNNRTGVTTTAGSGGTGATTSTTYNQDNSIRTVDGPGSETDPATRDRFDYTYDLAGRLINDGCNTHTYDAFDRVEKQITNGTQACGDDQHTTTYTYDGLDRQRSIQVTGSNTAGANRTTRNIYDGLATTLVGQLDAVNGDNNGPDVLYQLDPGNNPVAYRQTGTGPKTFLDTDGHGNITILAPASGSSVVCSSRYDPFGNPVDPAGNPDSPSDTNNGICHNNTNPAHDTGNAAWYRGQIRDGSTGNYQLGTRTYDPNKAAFTTPDNYRIATPSTDLGVGTDPLTTNTYGYVNGNPLNMTDDDGHRPACIDLDGCGVTKTGGTGRIGKSLISPDPTRAGGWIRHEQNTRRNPDNVFAAVRDAVGGAIGGILGLEQLVPRATITRVNLGYGAYVPFPGLALDREPTIKNAFYDLLDVNEDSWVTKVCELGLCTGVGTAAGAAKGLTLGAVKATTRRVVVETAEEVAPTVPGNAARSVAPSGSPRPKSVTAGGIPPAAANSGGGAGRTFTHFTDEAGARGIAGSAPSTVGESTAVGQLQFAKGQNSYLIGEGRIGVTDLGLDATPGQLNGIGVFGPKQQYAVQFTELDAFHSGVRVSGDLPSRNIFSIPGGCTITGTCSVTRVR